MSNENKADHCPCAESTAPVSPLRERLHSDIANLSSQLVRSHRATQILAAHPEFEQFIELLGLIRVPIRSTPISSERALVIE